MFLGVEISTKSKGLFWRNFFNITQHYADLVPKDLNDDPRSEGVTVVKEMIRDFCHEALLFLFHETGDILK